MTPGELREEIAIELEAIAIIIEELLSLQQDLANRVPTTREVTAASAFLAQFYNGVENILKRISLFHGVPLPQGATWHVELFQRFASPYPGLPQLFDDRLAATLSPYRRFRHVVFHGYSFQLDWNRMAEGVRSVHAVFEAFKAALMTYLQAFG